MSTLGHPNVMASFFADEQPDPSAQAISQRWWTSAFCAGDPATAQRRSLEPPRTRWIPIDWNIGKVDIWGDWAERSTTGETSFLSFLDIYIYTYHIYIHIRETVLNIYQDEPGLVFPSQRDCSMSQKLSVKVITESSLKHIDHTLRSAPDVSMCFFADEWGRNGLYHLVNLQKTMERSTMLSMGKSTISMAIFNSYFDITRGYLEPPMKIRLATSPSDQSKIPA